MTTALLFTGGLTALPASAVVSASAVACTASYSASTNRTYAARGSCTNVQARIDRYSGGIQSFYGAKGSTSSITATTGTNAGNYYQKWLGTSGSGWLSI